jgi:hypothetical protein
MAIGRISGPLLAQNLLRDGVNLAFETDLLYLDVNTGRIGIRKSNPVYELDVNGTINANNLKVTYTGPGTGVSQLGNLVISTGTISTTVGPVTIQPSGNESINLVGDTNVIGNLHATGNITADGNIFLGNNTSTDTVIFESEIASNIIPSQDQAFNLGSPERAWLDAYVSTLVTNQITSTNTLNIGSNAGLVQINTDLRVDGKNPIGTAPVITNVLHVTMDGNDTNDGRAADPSRACRTITGAIRSPYYRPGTLIKVYSGHYLENNPILLQPNTAVVGDDLRTCSIEPINKTQDLFHVQSGCYLAQMQFFNGRSGLLPGPYVNGTNRGAYATAFAPQVGGAQIDVYQSPYIQNCTNQSGPWLVDGTMFVPNQTVQVPQAIGVANFEYNTTTLVVTLTTGTIVPGLNVISGPQDPGFFNARTLLLANITFLQDQTVAWVNHQIVNSATVFVPQLNANTDFTNFTYNQAKCYRDVGLIVQNISYDVTFGGNEKAVEAGLAYWNGVINLIEGQQGQTTAAINYINQLGQLIINNSSTSALTYSSATTQIINTALKDGAVASQELNNAVNIITTIINNGPSSAPPLFNSCGPEAPLVSAELLLHANRNFLQNEVVSYVNATYPNFKYKQDYCFRDTGLIVDAVSQDIILGGNTKSIECGLSYYTGSKGDSSVAETVVVNNFKLIKNIIENGPSAAPAEVIGPNLGTNYSNAQDLLKQNRLFVQSEVSAYVRSLFNSGFRLTQAQQNSCYRDLGLILDAIADDTAAGGNKNTLFAALSYFNNGLTVLPNNQPQYTLLALDYMQTLCVNIIKNIKNTNLYQTLINQTFIPIVGNTAQVLSISNNVDRILTIINNGPDVIINNSPIVPTPITLIPVGNAAARNAATLLEANRYFIQSEVVAYVDNFIVTQPNYGTNYNRASCLRDTGLIVDALTLDSLFGGTSQSDFAGLQYWNQAGYTGQITTELSTTTAAINFVSSLAQKIVRNDTSGVRYTATYHPAGPTASTQNTSLTTATVAEATAIAGDFSIITNILTSGTSGVTDLIIPNGIVAKSGSILNAVNLLQANKIYIQEQAVAYVEANKTTGFVYNQSKCYRDVGYMIDSVSFDLLYGGNKQAVQSGVYYYSFSISDSAIAVKEKPQITAAYNYIKTLVGYIVRGQAVPLPYQTAVGQVLPGSVGTSYESDQINANLELITNIITTGPGVVSSPYPISQRLTNNYNAVDAFNLLTANKTFISAELTGWIDSTFGQGFNYNADNCYRDTGLIVDGIAFDILQNDNSQSIFAGMQYWNQSGYTGAIGRELTTTTAAINYAKWLAEQVIINNTVTSLQTATSQVFNFASVGSTTATVIIESLFNTVTNILTNGTVGVTNQIIPNSTSSSNSGIINAYNLLQSNKSFIENQVVAYVDANLAQFTYDRNKCLRDTGLIVDALAQDLLFGGTSQSDFAGLQYWNQSGYTGQITVELNQTISAINFVSNISQEIVQNITNGVRYNATYHPAGGSPSTQYTGSPSATITEANTISNDFSVITNILSNGTAGVTDLIVPNGFTAGSGNTLNAYNLLQANKTYIQEQAVAFVEANKPVTFTYDQAKCYRDVGYIIDSISVDLLYGGNRQAVQSGVYYYSFSTTSSAIPVSEKNQVTAAYNYIQTLTNYIVQGNAVPSPYQKAKTQQGIGGASGTSVQVAAVDNNILRITNIINNGPTGVTPTPIGVTASSTASIINAVAQLENNRDFIKAEVVAYIDQFIYSQASYNFIYNQEKCSRDVGLIVDAVSQDLLFNGTSQSNFAGLQYWAQGSTKIPGEQTTTTAAINYIRDLAIKVITNDTSGPRYQASVSQYTTATSATVVEEQKVYDEFNLVVTIINNGTNGVTDLIAPNGIVPVANAGASIAYNLLQQNKSYLQAEAIAFVNTIKSFGFTYDAALCSRDIGYIVDSVSFDILYGGNRQAVQSGVYYFGFDGTSTTIPNEIPQVTDAYNFIKSLSSYIVTGKRPVTQYQSTVTQVLSTNVGTSAEATTIGSCIDLILNIINTGPTAAYSAVPISLTPVTTSAVVNAASLMEENKAFIQAETIAYINQKYTSGFNYNRDTCKRDIGYIIDSVSFDLLHGGNRQSIQSGVYYYGFNPSSSVITYELAQVTAAYDRIKTIAANIITNTAVTPTVGNTSSQTYILSASSAGSVQINKIINEVNIITDIINNGPNPYYPKKPINLTSSVNQGDIDAYRLLSANRTFIQNELIAYINYWFANPFVYDKIKCARDTSLIVDSVALDLVYEGSTQSTFAGLQYWAQGSTQIPNEQTTTTNAILYAKSLVTATIAAYPAAITSVNSNFNEIVYIINSGTNGVTDIIIPNGLPTTNSSTIAAYNLIQSAKSTIQQQTVNWVTANNPGFVYNTSTCYRDVGYIIDCVSFDLLNGGNRQSIQAGVYYYGFDSNTTNIPNEIPQVIAAYNQLKYILSSVIQNKPLTNSYQEVYPQVIIPAYMGVASAIPGEELITLDAINYLNSISLNVISNTPVPVVRSTATQVYNYALEGGVHASTAITRNYRIISDIIYKGPGAAPVSFVGSGMFATTGVSTDDVRNSPKILSITTQSGNVYTIVISGPTVGDSQNGTLYFGNTAVFPATDEQVEAASLKYTGSSSTWNSRKVDPIGSMGGSLVDGSVVSDRSPIQSFVYDAFTQINQGGRGIHVTNNGYAQLVSVFTIFCSVGVQTDNGGIASIVNSNANFGDICLLSNGYGKLEFSGTIYNPPYPTYQINGEYYPFGYYPQNGQVEIYLPDTSYRPHIALIMEVEPPLTYINYTGDVVPYNNDQGYPGFLNAQPSVGYLTTGSITISPIDTTGIAVGNVVYVRDQFGNTGTTVNNVFTPYVYPGTVVTEVSYQTVTLSQGLGSGGSDPKNTPQLINTDYFNVYFCGNAYYTVLSSTINDSFGKPLGVNILSSSTTAVIPPAQTPANQIGYEIDALDYISSYLCDSVAGSILYDNHVPDEAIVFVKNCIKNIMEPIILATDLTTAENLAFNTFGATKTGNPPLGASLAISIINAYTEEVVAKTITYITGASPNLNFTNFNQEKCKRDIRLILRQINYDLKTGGNYYSVYSGLSYWYRAGTHHIVTLEENVTNTALFPDGAIVNFYQRSYQSASGYTFEYVGAGVTYSALPQRGIKDPVQGKEVVQVNNGKVFYTSTDQNGDFRIGPSLVISQATGVLSGRTFTKSLFANMTPFILAIEGGG